MLLAGAWAVQVGTATLVDPAGARRDRARASLRYLKEKGIPSPADLRGRLRVPARVRRGSRRPRDPAARTTRSIVALDVSDLERAERARAALAPARSGC